MSEEFKIQTEVFQGPLDLLLTLVEKRKFFINDISLSKVADDFLSYIKSHDNFSLSKTANFILIASALVLIKSKSLFPNLKLTEEEVETIEELEKRLRIYRQFKEISLRLASRLEKKVVFQRRRLAKKIRPVFSPDKAITQKSMRLCLDEVLKTLPKPDRSKGASIQAIISLDEMITKLTTRIVSSARMSFKGYAQETHYDKPTMVVSFLAILELVREGSLIVEQVGQYEDIYFEKKSIDNDIDSIESIIEVEE